MANGRHLSKIGRIRKKYRDLKIFVVIHDKQHGIWRFDPLDRFFRKGIERFLPVSYAVYMAKKIAFDSLYPGFIRSADKVFTVSNHTLQALDHKNLKRVTPFYQPTWVSADDSPVSIEKDEPRGEYILFLSGGRPEKNLGRALLAYHRFFKRTDTGCRLFITGIDRDRLLFIAGRLKLDRGFINDHIVCFDYVETDELADLYRNCRYLLFVSKGEGFGLPVLEAMQFGKTVLCSRQSSIPEVAGSILYYVNAYDVDSITEGMLYLNDDRNLRYREELVERKKKIIEEQIELDKYVLVNEILKQTHDR